VVAGGNIVLLNMHQVIASALKIANTETLNMKKILYYCPNFLPRQIQVMPMPLLALLNFCKRKF